MEQRLCTRTGCRERAVATLTYVYADSTAVLGPLADDHVPGSYHLCRLHCEQLSAPRGWTVVRSPELDHEVAPDAPLAQLPVVEAPEPDDLLALADAVREVGLLPEEVATTPQAGRESRAQVVVLAERRHLRAVQEGEQPD